MQLYPNSKKLSVTGLAFLSLSLVANAQAPKSDYTCAGSPNDDGATYTTYGVTFKLMCARATAAAPLDSVPAATLKECADKCALHENCQTADWNSGKCHRKKEYIPTIAGAFDTWFPIQEREPRTCPPDADRLAVPKPNPDVVDSPICPKDNGNMFTTDDGAYWTLLCCTHNADGSLIPGSESVVSSFKDCAAKCSTTKGCQSYAFANKRSDHSYGTCKLYSTGGFSTVEWGDDTHDFAYVTAPPAIDSPDTLTIACPTECPAADGREYKSQGGELFHMDCAKRHGTQVIFEDVQPTFKDCIDACSKYVPCHSVDYHASSSKCYFSNHHGAPTLAASGFQSAYSLGCAGACDGEGCCGKSGTTSSGNSGTGSSAANAASDSSSPASSSPATPVATSTGPDVSTKKCPGTGTIFKVDGVNWKAYCKTGYGTGSTVVKTSSKFNSVEDCVKYCSLNKPCSKAHFHDQTGDCWMYQGGAAPSGTLPWDL